VENKAKIDLFADSEGAVFEVFHVC
jgi:hypothetical protein